MAQGGSSATAEATLDADLQAMTKLHEIGSLFLSDREHLGPVLTKVVHAAIEISGADFGNIQLLDPKVSHLRIAAYEGFSKEWLAFWDSVSEGRGACGTALERGERVVIEDLEQSPIFMRTPALEVQRKAGVRAVQSTPLLTRSGRALGMISTHYRTPHRPTPRELRLVDLVARQVADIIETWEANRTTSEALAASERANERLTRLVDEKKRLETELVEARNFLENVLESSTEYSIIAKDLDRRIVAWNRGAARSYGYDASEVLGQPSDMLHVPDDLRSGLVGELHRRALAEGHAMGLFRRRRKDGSEFLARVSITRQNDASGSAIGYLAVSHDVSIEQRHVAGQRFLAEVGEALQTTLDYGATVERIAQLVVGYLGDVCSIDTVEEGGGIQRRRTIHSDPAKMALAEAVQRIVPRPPHPVWEVLATRRSLCIPEVDAEVFRAAGITEEHRRLLESMGVKSAMFVPLVARGHLIAVLTVASSRPDRRYTLEDLGLAEELGRRASLALDNAQLYEMAQRAIRTRDRVLGIVAHDLRGPLGTVFMQGQLLRREAGGTGRGARQPGAVIERAVTRMNRLIRDLLDVTRLENGQLSIEGARVATRALVLESAEGQRAVAAAGSLELRLDVQEDLPDIWADSDRLLQVLENLIGNAVKFTGPRGIITLGAASPVARAHEVLFWVKDTGSGIAPEDVRHVFERFWQAKDASTRHGAGLGLPIVKGIVEAHGGRIWVETARGQGTSVFFTIPTAEARGADAASAGETVEPGGLPGAAGPLLVRAKHLPVARRHSMKRKVAIIGRGNVGTALERGLSRAGYEVRGATREEAHDVAAWGDVVILAVPWRAEEVALMSLGDAIDGKPLVDVTNALTRDMHGAVDASTTSGAEELQKRAPRAKVVKAFNTVFAAEMDSGEVRGEQLSTFVAGDDPQAKEPVLQMARDIGFDAVDVGPLERARAVEAMAQLIIQLGIVQKMGTNMGFRLVH
jgi:PAS domain S-box-containing protein